MKRTVFTIVLTLCLVAGATASEGLIQVKSPYSVEQTLDRFEQAARAKGMTIFTRIDHAAGAASVDKDLRPTALLIFGNPKVGTLLMQSNQAVAIDLPMKALAWKDESGQVWLAYNDPEYLVKRHVIKDRDAVVQKINKALHAFCKAATKP
ncbi:uncharacterized protein (DUF302 family) [Thiogranum longum]|uniref:Uncharacterized protein (DUF302 family) n=1 Tax=Thiogranum longum TaxID=1537524 RepID=A0A4R1H5B7_9GAMM|nr:DUF302 domain-containing protein [Thiogranum longum]TCK16907.1 uncharacterized protein (DUF302 family) [Thiogranum longum]